MPTLSSAIKGFPSKLIIKFSREVPRQATVTANAAAY